jgi:hypothetical protein
MCFLESMAKGFEQELGEKIVLDGVLGDFILLLRLV